AINGWQDYGNRNYLTDEEIVLMAVLTAIETGRDTVILTWDPHLLEQFVKLMSLLASDYRGYCFGEFAANREHSIPWIDSPLESDQLVGSDGEAVAKLSRFVVCEDRTGEEFLPEPFHQVKCYCYLLGNHCDDLKVTPLAFAAESEMAGVLRE